MMKNLKRMQVMSAVSDRLRFAMELRNIQQTTLACELGLSQPEMRYYLKGKVRPRPLVLQEMAFVLRVSYNWLAWEIGEHYVDEFNYPFHEFHDGFQERFAFLLWTRGIGVHELAAKMGVPCNEIEHWMKNDGEPNGLPFGEKMKTLCALFDVSEAWLAGDAAAAMETDGTMKWLKFNHSILERMN